MAWISNHFNAWFGSNISFFANASDGKVLVAISENEMKISKASLSMKNGIDGVELKSKTNISKFNIPSREFHRFQRKNDNDYLTVISHNGSVICESYRIGANMSYIITNDTIFRQKYGDSNLFRDQYGKEY